MQFGRWSAIGFGPLRHVATTLLLLTAVLAGAGSPFRGPAVARPAGFEPAAQLVASAHRSGYVGVVATRPGLLSSAQLAGAVIRRGRLPVDQQAHLDRLLVSASPVAQGYLVKAFAAGHTVEELAVFAAAIAGHGPQWLNSRLRVADLTETGPVEFHGGMISQYDDTTCGSTVIVVARAMRDPIYALQLTTGGRPGSGEHAGEGFVPRLRTEEQRIHDETDRFWPQIAGTPPWGVAQQMGDDPDGLRTPYAWVSVMPALPGRADQIIRQAIAAVDRGYPVPILIGHLVPRHYVLLVRHNALGALFYEPTAGSVVFVSSADLRRRDFSELGYPDLEGAVLPSGSMVNAGLAS